ncbi:hypothetical protein QQ008_23160, partial [Fulvivirgaceae bacterium BMA10]|nr:hypothetical protein [Fulvivirgaceae bacterium BMA10]
LRGDGSGNFAGHYPYESGLYADGDVKRTSLIHINGQSHLLVAINNGPLKIIRIRSTSTENVNTQIASNFKLNQKP